MICVTGIRLIRAFVYYPKWTWAYHLSRPYWHLHSPRLLSEPDD